MAKELTNAVQITIIARLQTFSFIEFQEPLSGELSASPQARLTGRYPS